MNDTESLRAKAGTIPGGSPMNLSCTTATAAGDAATTYTIVFAGPGAPVPSTPPGSTTMIAPNANVEWQLTGVGPDGNHVPPGFKFSGVLVYSTP